MSEEEAVQLLGIFLAFINSVNDRRSFRNWWVSFRSRFLEVAYPTPAGTRIRSLSVDAWLSADPSLPSRRPNSLLHIILCMLVDWTQNPVHARAMLLRSPGGGGDQQHKHKHKQQGGTEQTSVDDAEEDSTVDNDTAQFLLDLCCHMCTSLSFTDETMPILRPVMQLYYNLAMVPRCTCISLLFRWLTFSPLCTTSILCLLAGSTQRASDR
jgi:hypothetical protein